MAGVGGKGGEQVQTPGEHPAQTVVWGHFPSFSIYCCFFLPLTLILSVAAKLSCSYSGFSSPRVEWKFAHGDITSLVCYNNKITGESLHLLADCLGCRGLTLGLKSPGPSCRLSWGKKRAPCALGATVTSFS